MDDIKNTNAQRINKLGGTEWGQRGGDGERGREMEREAAADAKMQATEPPMDIHQHPRGANATASTNDESGPLVQQQSVVSGYLLKRSRKMHFWNQRWCSLNRELGGTDLRMLTTRQGLVNVEHTIFMDTHTYIHARTHTRAQQNREGERDRRPLICTQKRSPFWRVRGVTSHACVRACVG